jgi:hypothetical protein
MSNKIGKAYSLSTLTFQRRSSRHITQVILARKSFLGIVASYVTLALMLAQIILASLSILHCIPKPVLGNNDIRQCPWNYLL